MRARLTRGEGITRADRGLDNPHESRRTTLPVLLTVDLQAFAPRFIDGHARANRLKPSGIASRNAVLRLYLIPAFGRKRLDAIKGEDVQRLKAQLEFKSPKTVNNVLTVLSVLLKKAVEWEVIERMPCTVKLLRVDKGTAAFHDFDEYERLVEVARSIDPRTLLVVLLGGDAGMRCGEILALEWNDVDLVKRQLCVRQSDWNGQVGTPKSGRLRYVPLTRRLTAALVERPPVDLAPGEDLPHERIELVGCLRGRLGRRVNRQEQKNACAAQNGSDAMRAHGHGGLPAAGWSDCRRRPPLEGSPSGREAAATRRGSSL
jgi:integrase